MVHMGLRARLTCATALVFLVLLGVASALLVSLQDHAGLGVIDSVLTIRAEAVMNQSSNQGENVDNADNVTIAADNGTVVQLVGIDRSVIAATDNIAGGPPISDIIPANGPVATTISGDAVRAPGDRFRLLARSMTSDGRPAIIYTAVSLRDVDAGHANLVRLFVFAVPLLTILATMFTWVIAGRALRPVENIRAELDQITLDDLHRRISARPRSDEIGLLITTINATLDRLEAASTRQQRFIGDAAHELRSPLTGLIAQLEVASEHPETVDSEETIQRLHADAMRMRHLVDDLLLLARSDSGTLASHRVPVDLDDVVFDVALTLTNTDSGIDFDTSAVSGARVTADPNSLRRLVTNLVENATRHARRIVRLSLQETDGLVEFVVDDDGPGIPPEKRAEVFERFARLDAARTTDDGGAGLGLALVAEIVRAHDGTVELDDGPLGGARFTIRLPAG